jgi:hypothetical protein
VDRWLAHCEYNDELKYLEEDERIIMRVEGFIGLWRRHSAHHRRSWPAISTPERDMLSNKVPALRRHLRDCKTEMLLHRRETAVIM